ncbi:Na+/H+ antiporter subunit E [Thermosphaera chiliense]|uniref:Na+/H+ antiporter subunit E n=1 Tax=Thermosphaera chiliense TaxID=3402707 RepID=A0A7M1UR38_9CREN|nr:Na+/H+ antiporter subunit E [Thermosphaera aggregans]QOR93913.1 Na+/H+ antiporter subunit E [Thermosphaera aggregans]
MDLKIVNGLVVALIAFITYIVFSGSITTYDIITGVIVSLVTGFIFSTITLSNPRKALNPKRWALFVIYALRYLIIDETKAHVDVIKRILHPKTPVNPAIVKVPFNVSTDYAITAIANSITNTPGTVVVDVDEKGKVFYVHWIDAKTLEPEKAREAISSVFEKYAGNMFD